MTLSDVLRRPGLCRQIQFAGHIFVGPLMLQHPSRIMQQTVASVEETLIDLLVLDFMVQIFPQDLQEQKEKLLEEMYAYGGVGYQVLAARFTTETT